MPTVLSCSSLWSAFSPIYWCGFFRGCCSRHQSDSFALSGVGKTHKAATLSQDDCFYWPPPFWVVGWPQAFRSLTPLQIYSNPVILGQWHWLFFLLTGEHLAPGPTIYCTFLFRGISWCFLSSPENLPKVAQFSKNWDQGDQLDLGRLKSQVMELIRHSSEATC